MRARTLNLILLTSFLILGIIVYLVILLEQPKVWVIKASKIIEGEYGATLLWSPRGDAIAIIRDKDVYIYNITTGLLRHILFKFSNPYAEERIIKSAWSPSGKLLAIRTNWKLVLIKPSEGKGLWSLNVNPIKGFLTSFLWINDSMLLASTIEDSPNGSISRLMLFSVNGSRLHEEVINEPIYLTSCLRFRHTCSYLALGSYTINSFGLRYNVSSDVIVKTTVGKEILFTKHFKGCVISRMAWSNIDKKLLTISAYCGLKGPYFTYLKLMLLNISGDIVWTYTLPIGRSVIDEMLGEENIKWSGTGNYILFEVGPHSSNYMMLLFRSDNNITLAKFGGYGIRSLANSSLIFSSSAWLSKRDVLAVGFVKGRNNELLSKIFIYNVSNKGVRLWLRSQEFKGYLRSISWSPKGDLLAIALIVYDADKTLIMILTPFTHKGNDPYEITYTIAAFVLGLLALMYFLKLK